ncbi:MAG: hypothetical protein HGA65_03165, partial [Oscillochloris sp.]|nr:hypothetical protein [Oscillochloris sp.]
VELLIRLQQALQATESALSRAEEATRERDLLISIAAHDLRTPLTVILGQALLVRQRAERAGMDARILQTLTTISTQAERLNQMIDALLDLSRIQEGRLTIQPSLCDLVALLRRVVDAVQSTVPSSHQIHLEVPIRTITLMGDALRLEQVFFNLLGNAVKYSPDGGQITIWVESVGQVVQIHIRDHGIGIPTDALPFLFTRFYRAPNAIPQATSSLGVGLYIVRELIHAHGGSIAVDSIEGQGSTFTVQLPLSTDRPGRL